MRATSKYIRVWITIAILLLSVLANANSALAGIDLTQEQKDQLKDMAMDTRSATKSERDNLRRARMDLFQLYSIYNLDEQKVKSALNRISDSQENLLNIHLRSQTKLRSILSEPQFEQVSAKLNKFHKDGALGVRPEDAMFDRAFSKQMADNNHLNPNQLEDWNRLTKKYKPSLDKAIQKLQQDSQKMLNLYSNYQLDIPAAKRLINSIHDSQVKLSDLSFKKQQAIRSILSEQQFQQLKQEMLDRMKNKGDHNRS